jgi:predicted Zn-dependent protease
MLHIPVPTPASLSHKPARRPWLGVLWLCGCALVIALTTNAYAGKGEKAHLELIEQMPLYDDQALSEYVRRVGQRLAGVSDMPDVNYRFNIINSPDINAFAAPGGWIYVNRGLLAYLETEDQLAAVLGHEIGHVALRHHGRRKSRAATSKVAATVMAILTGSGDVARAVDLYGAEWVSGFGRETELEADEAGARYLARAGYDPYAMVEVIQILKDQEIFSKKVANAAPTYHGVFSTHPKNDKRLHGIIEQAYAQMSNEGVEPVGSFLESIDGLAWGNPAADGIVKGSRYYHGNMGFVVDFPKGWEVKDSPVRVLAHPRAKANVTFIAMIGQGVEEEMTPREFIEDQLNIELADEGVALEPDGFPALVATAANPGASEVLLVGAVLKDATGFAFRAETREAADVEGLREKLQAVVASFRRMQASDLQEATTTRVKVVEARPGDTYASLGRASTLDRFPEEQLRLLNGDFPHGEPRAGDLIKTVQ